MTKEQFLVRLGEAIQEEGSQSAFAKKHGLTQPYLSDVLHGRREPGPKVLDPLGLTKEVVFVRKVGEPRR